MKLNNNEKKTLKLLLNNSKTSDSEIATKLKISSVAVGKIRKKLERSVIDSYTVNLNYAKLGIQAFAIAIARLTEQGLEKGGLEVEQELMKNAHIISVYRIPKASSTHIILYGFKDLNELDSFFHSGKFNAKLHNIIETNELFTFSHNSLIKNNPTQLFQEVIDNFGEQIPEIKFDEIKKFKRRYNERGKLLG
ncbi:MAG: Lrp/AsnC family transcriptional regulator [Nanoarchaeota archaeon]|nr:Lrp/AsnC family transcriptional regulator [Nanoarchaeota archaeon]